MMSCAADRSGSRGRVAFRPSARAWQSRVRPPNSRGNHYHARVPFLACGLCVLAQTMAPLGCGSLGLRAGGAGTAGVLKVDAESRLQRSTASAGIPDTASRPMRLSARAGERAAKGYWPATGTVRPCRCAIWTSGCRRGDEVRSRRLARPGYPDRCAPAAARFLRARALGRPQCSDLTLYCSGASP
jgi:hypothetical protein